MHKKVFACFSICIILLFLSYYKMSENSISDKLIRFHVIANSDSEEDQGLKLKVRDEVLKEIGPKLEKSKSKEQSENILIENLGLIEECAKKVIYDNGKSYTVSAVLGQSSFPTKMYSTIALPAGEYEALKIVIGNGEGKNWWCVMFPPLCFIDITNGVTSKDTETRLKTVLSTQEYNSILNNPPKEKMAEANKKPISEEKSLDNKVKESKPEKIEMRLKSVELAKFLYEKIENALDKK